MDYSEWSVHYSNLTLLIIFADDTNREGNAPFGSLIPHTLFISVTKTYEQMSLAIERNATRVWIVNVGDLKPYELAIEFFITYGWDASRWNEANLDSFVAMWAGREFNLDTSEATIVSDIIGNLTRFNARRKPEMLNGTTYSLIDYRE